MKRFKLEGDFFIPVIVFQLPAFEIERPNLVTGIATAIQQIGKQHRNGPIRMVEQNHAQLDRLEAVAVARTEACQCLIRGGQPDDGFRLSRFDKRFHRREGAGRRTAEDKMLLIRDGQQAQQVIAGIAAVKEEDTLFGKMREQGRRFLPFGTVEADDRAGDRQATEDIVERGNQTLGVMPFAWLVKSAVRIEGVPERLRGREREFRAVDGIHGQALPGILRVVRPEGVSDLNGLVSGRLKDFPRDFLAGFTQGTPMDGFSLGPQTAPAGITEQGAHLRINAVAVALTDHG